MMYVHVFVNNAWQENTIILYDETNEAAVIDCGCFSKGECQVLQRFLLEKGLTPVLLLNTHLHIDHIFGNGFMLEQYGLSARAHRADAFWVENAGEYAAMLGIRGITPPPPLGEYIEDGERLSFGNTTLQAIHVPGHSPGSLCFYHEASQVLVTGDVLFEGSIGRADLPGGDLETLLEGIRNKLFVLPDRVRVIPGHGDQTTIGEEKRTNPFFR